VFKEVRALSNAGYSVDVVCLRKAGQLLIEVIDGVRVYRLPILNGRGSMIRYLFGYGLSFSMMTLVITILHLWRHYNLFQVNTMPDALVFTTLIPRLLGAKVLLDMHEPIPELWVTLYSEKVLPVVLKLLIMIEQKAIKYSNGVITVNERIRKRFIERGADRQKINVIRNVPEEAIFEYRNSYKLEKEFTLISHGTVVERYGHEVIIRALSLLRDKIDNLRVYIVGDGDYLEQIITLSKQLGCFDLISFTGWVPITQIPEFIFRSDIGLAPFLKSPFSDLCQPNKLFEYVALKKPVIASRLKAIEESFDDSCILFYEPGNPEELARCVFELYNNPDKGKRLAENAYIRYEKLRWSKTKEIYLEIVHGLINR
jgi:glycosyltransferase involved in cell wall biosynthesis